MKRRIFLVAALMAGALVPFGAQAAPTKVEGFITSFDNVLIKYHLFIPEGASASDPVPVVLRTHGWGGAGERSLGTGSLAERLVNNGYALLTWDQRGFGQSGGRAEVDDRDIEGKDVSALISQVLVPRGDIATETSGDPLIGMTGGSYAGGIQFAASSVDSRIDVIAPEIAWSDLPRSLFPAGVPKFGWDTLLYAAGHLDRLTNGRGPSEYNPVIHEAYATTVATNKVAPEYVAWFDSKSPKHYIEAVTIPTLVIEGSIDTLFTMNEGIDNFLDIAGNGAPAKLLLFNGGHVIGTSVPAGNSRATIDCAILKWFAPHLGGGTDCHETADADASSASTTVAYQDQLAAWHTATSWPPTTGTKSASGWARVASGPAPSGGGGPVNGNPNAPGSARIPIFTAESGTQVVGVPHVSGTASVTGAEAFLFFKLVDAATGVVVSDQITPIRFEGLGTHSFDFDLFGVSHLLESGKSLALEISGGSVSYTNARTPAVVDVSVTATVPTL